jgi:hypothetical protein
LQFDKTFPLKCLLVAHGRGAEASPEKFTGSDGDKLLEEMEVGWDRAEAAFRQLRDFMQNDLKVYADKVIRSYNSFIPLFDTRHSCLVGTPRAQTRWSMLFIQS